jgi:hypothetical protein
MMKLRATASLALVAAAFTPAAAWARSDPQIWTTASASVKLADRWRLSEDVVARFSDHRNGLYEIESSTLLSYRFDKSVSFAAGYVHNPQYSGGDFTVMEHRAREQISFDSVARLGSGKVSARIRLEQRWREGVDGVGWRIRPYAKYSVPLKGKIALNLSTEPFVNLNETTFQRASGPDRVRNLATVSAPLSKSLAGEAGYMNQHGFVRDGPDTSDHVAYFALSLSL